MAAPWGDPAGPRQRQDSNLICWACRASVRQHRLLPCPTCQDPLRRLLVVLVAQQGPILGLAPTGSPPSGLDGVFAAPMR